MFGVEEFHRHEMCFGKIAKDFETVDGLRNFEFVGANRGVVR